MVEKFEDFDPRDLADVVQRLRMIGYRAYLGPTKVRIHTPWFEDLDAFPPYIEALTKVVAEAKDERKAEASYVLSEIQKVYDALLAKPRKPSADEVVARYVSSEIGDRTAQYVMDWDVWELHDQCRQRGLPPMQMVLTDEDEEAIEKLQGLFQDLPKRI